MPVDRESVPSSFPSRRIKEARARGMTFTPDYYSHFGATSSIDAWGRGAYGGEINYSQEAGDLRLNSIVMTYVNWMTTNFPAADFQTQRRGPDNTWQVVPDHLLTLRWHQPNPYQPGLLVCQPLVADYMIYGDGYLLKHRNGAGRVVEWWWENQWKMRPRRTDSTDYVSYYERYVNGIWERWEVQDVIHFRNGIDPLNDMCGLAPLWSALREIFTDNEAAAFAATMLRNLGAPGLLISPAGESGLIRSPDELKSLIIQKTTGSHRGEPLIFRDTSLKVDYLSRPPAEIGLNDLRDRPEERVGGLFNIPPQVVGLHVGLKTSSYNNMTEARRAAYEGNLVPTQQVFAATLTTQALPDLGNALRERAWFDQSGVQALQEDADAKAKRWTNGYVAGVLKRGVAAQNGYGVATEPADDIYRQPGVLASTPTSTAVIPVAGKMLVNGHKDE